jgi:hypothetical protein
LQAHLQFAQGLTQKLKKQKSLQANTPRQTSLGGHSMRGKEARTANMGFSKIRGDGSRVSSFGSLRICISGLTLKI